MAVGVNLCNRCNVDPWSRVLIDEVFCRVHNRSQFIVNQTAGQEQTLTVPVAFYDIEIMGSDQALCRELCFSNWDEMFIDLLADSRGGDPIFVKNAF